MPAAVKVRISRATNVSAESVSGKPALGRPIRDEAPPANTIARTTAHDGTGTRLQTGRNPNGIGRPAGRVDRPKRQP
jgi:hypothetical protein